MADYKLLRKPDAVVESYPWGELHWFASGKLGNSEHMTLGKCILRPGCSNRAHHHPNCEEILHVLSGTIKHYVAGVEEAVEMGPGDTIVIPPLVQHNAENTGAREAELVIVFSSPERQTRGE